MSESIPPGGARSALTADLRDSSGSLPAVRIPKGLEFTDPLSPEIYAWLVDFNKALKGMRVYALNNEMLQKFLEAAERSLTRILEKVPELMLTVREDRLLYGRDTVHLNADREEGLPFALYRNAFRRLTFLRGMSRDELVALMQAIITDYASLNYSGEDLVAALWRLSLPHLYYLTIDAISVETNGAQTVEDRNDLERIQADIEGIVAAIYKTTHSDEDIVAGVSITREDLEALKDIRTESREDIDMLDHATARAITDVPKAQLESVAAFLKHDTRDAMVARMMDILIGILFKEQSGRASATTIDVLQQLFDSMVIGQRYAYATALIHRLQTHAESSPDMQHIHISRHLLKLFASESRVSPVLTAFNDGYKTASVTEMVDFLRALGPSIAPILLGSLDTLTSPAHRRLMCDLIIEIGVPDVSVLMEKSNNAKWFVVRDILMVAQTYPLSRVTGLVASALVHPHPKVRAHAVGMLRAYGRGTADRLVAERLMDADLEVRLAAARVAAARRSVEGRRALEAILGSEGVADREPRELRMLMAAYAAIAGKESVPLLDRILSPGFFARLKSTEAQVAAAFALGSVHSESATSALQRGARTLSSRVRDACRRALGRGDGEEKTPSGGTPVPDRIPGASSDPTLPARSPIEAPTPSDGFDASKARAMLKIPDAPTEIDRALPPNSADLEFTVSMAAPNAPDDPLANAPPFEVGDIDLAESAEPMTVVHRERPVIPRVDRDVNTRDEIPGNLPPPPSGASARRGQPAAPASFEHMSATGRFDELPALAQPAPPAEREHVHDLEERAQALEPPRRERPPAERERVPDLEKLPQAPAPPSREEWPGLDRLDAASFAPPEEFPRLPPVEEILPYSELEETLPIAPRPSPPPIAHAVEVMPDRLPPPPASADEAAPPRPVVMDEIVPRRPPPPAEEPVDFESLFREYVDDEPASATPLPQTDDLVLDDSGSGGSR